jgi:apolipoprotein N-acyltransferase
VKPTGDKRSVALVQANIDQNEKWVASLIPGHIKLHQEMSEPLWDSDIIVWPESAVPQLLQRSESLIAQLTSQAKESNTAFITGIPHYDIANKSFHNSILGLGDASGHYLKRRLVPFGEYVPLEDWLRGLIEFFDLPMSNFRPGPAEQEDLHAGELSLAPLICYEVVYPDMIRRGAGRQADLLLTISNDTWFGASIGPLQHLQMARMRAKETGRAMIRGTNNGVSALIDADGSILKQSRQFQREVLRGDVSIYTGDTLVSRYGHRPLLGLCLTLLVLPLLTAKLRARQANS